MRRERASSYPVSIFIAGDLDDARRVCRAFCDEEGLCVTVTPTRYVYTGGEEEGVIVGLINYPRFPASPHDILATAKMLALELMHRLEQSSVSVQTPDETHWFSIRAADTAQRTLSRRAETTGSAGTESGLVRAADAPKNRRPFNHPQDCGGESK